MDEKQKVLIVHNYYKIPGGEDTVVENEKRLLEQHGHKVVLYTRSNREMESFSALQKLLLPLTSLFSLRTYREVRRLIQSEGIDVVHVHNTLNLISPSVYYAAFSCGVPAVQTIHNFRLLCPAATFVRQGKLCEECVEQGLGCAVRHSCYRGSRMQTLMSVMILKLHRMLGTYRRLNYICLTEFNREKLLLLNKGRRRLIREEHVFVKPNFVWDTEQKETEKKEQYLYAGRLEQLKGIRVLLEAWRALPEKRLLICGSGPEESWILGYLKEHDMTQAELLGQCSHERILELLEQSKALIMPTLWYEGQPMVILESYAAGTPVIASALGNAGAMVIPQVTGLRFEAGKPEALAEAVREFERIGKWDTRKTYEMLYEPEENYRLLREIYERAEEK